MCVYVCMMGVRMEPIITGIGGGSMDGTLVFLYKLDENFCLCFIARIFYRLNEELRDAMLDFKVQCDWK